MNIQTLKIEMSTMNQDELTQIVNFANQLKSGSTTWNKCHQFSVGQKVNVVQKTKSTSAVIVKMNPKKCVVEMNWQGRGLSKVNVPYSMLEAA